jgi:DNA-binding NarL/FixJ family response regulator
LQTPAKVLLVDDHPAARRTARAVLGELGQAVARVCGEAENGRQALEKVRDLDPDIVLLDIGMPVMDGVQAAYEIRRIDPSIKIVFFTINDSPEAFTAARLLGVCALVPKSSSAKLLISTIKNLLADKQSSRR